jgi:hypothetical protein
VAGAFLALAFLALALAGPMRAWPAALTIAALAPIALLSVAFPEGGAQPFVASAFYPALAGVLLIGAVIPPEQRVLRIGTGLYALALIGAYVLPSAVGGNVDRLGALVGGPVAACVLAGEPGWRRGLLVVLAPLLLYWQANAPVADFAAASSDPAVHSSYYTPLLDELRTLGVGYGARPARIEVVPTVDHWEARWVAPHAMIARGWERQLDQHRDGLFYNDPQALDAERYRRWLQVSAISYVALPDAPLDYSAKAEARLLRTGRLGYLREVWRGRHWRLFAVVGAVPLVSPPAALRSVGIDELTLYAPRPGAYTVRVHFTPYWALAGGGGCVSRSPADWTLVQAKRAGDLHLVISFSLARVLSHGPRCG